MLMLALTMLIIYLKEYYREPRRMQLKVEARYRKYLIPKSFWDDVNNLELAIYQMGYDELDRVEFLIDQFCDKYSQIADHNVFRTRVANILTRYQLRKKYILQHKTFYHQ